MSNSVSRSKLEQTDSDTDNRESSTNYRKNQESPENKPTSDLPSEATFQERWEYFLDIVKGILSSQKFQTWIVPIIPVNFVKNKLILRIPSQFFYEWLISEYQDLLLQNVQKVFGGSAEIEYLVATSSEKPEEMNLQANHPEKVSDTPMVEEKTPLSFDDRFHFNNYYVKNDNELALRAAQTVARHPGKTDFNPLFIYGSSGCGKTHLLHAIGNYIHQHKKRKKITFLTSENFINQYIHALQQKRLNQFYNQFSQTDILLLDDLQFLSNKKKSQEGLFYFLSEFERQHKQIVLTSNQPPVHLTFLDKRLLNFLQKGLIIDLIRPGYDTRRKFIQEYCHKTDYSILPEVREFLATSMGEGMQQLRALMIRIVAQSSLIDKPVSLEEVRKLLKIIDFSDHGVKGAWEPRSPINLEKILKYVSEYLNVPVDLIIGYSRQREVVFARQVAIYLGKEHSAATFQSLGYLFENRHYTAIIYNYKRIKKEMKNNPAIYNLIREIQNQLTDNPH